MGRLFPAGPLRTTYEGASGTPQSGGKDDQQNGNDRQRRSGYSHYPVVRRFAIFTLAVFVGYFVSILGWQYFDNNRRPLGSALVLGGGSLAFGGLALLLVTAFPWSWGWLL